MADEEQVVVHLHNSFYQDGFNKVLLALALMLTAVGLLIAASTYMFFAKPSPINFATGNEWRIIPSVPVDQPYVKPADLLQWVSNVAPLLFKLDFVSFDDETKQLTQYFTVNGWKKYLDQQSIYANNNNVQNSRLFISAAPDSAPVIINQGLLSGRYGWWVQIPINVYYSNFEKKSTQPLVLQLLLVRIPTDDNLDGVAIDNVVINMKNSGG